MQLDLVIQNDPHQMRHTQDETFCEPVPLGGRNHVKINPNYHHSRRSFWAEAHETSEFPECDQLLC